MGLRPSKEVRNNRIGIDLATKEIGVAVYIDGEHKQFMGFQVSLKKAVDWNKDLFEELKQIVGEGDLYRNFEIYIEVGNFGSPLVTQKFAYVAGMLAAMFYEKGCEVVHLVRPSDWFKALTKSKPDKDYHTMNNNQLTRNIRKQISIAALLEDIAHDVMCISDIKDITNDIADAYFVAKFGNRCMHAFWDKNHKEKFKKQIKEKRNV